MDYKIFNRQRGDWLFASGDNEKKNTFVTLDEVITMDKSCFEDFYVPEVEEVSNGIFFKTFNRRHTMTEFYTIRYCWFDMNGIFDHNSCGRYYRKEDRPQIMWRIIIDNHTTGYMTPSYFIKTDNIVMESIMGVNSVTNNPETKYVFSNASLPDEMVRKMAEQIMNIKFENFW